MDSYTFNLKDLKIISPFLGERKYKKLSYPIKVGLYTLIENRDAKLFFDLNGEIKFIHGKIPDWIHPNEFIKRTKANDFIYYSSGEYYGGIYDATGEYYVPCFQYPSNNLWQKDIKGIVEFGKALWKDIVEKLKRVSIKEIPKKIRKDIEKIVSIDNRYLKKRAMLLKKIYDANITVLPPDTRHVDYEIIPIIISDGCLYHCKFCRVKSRDVFSERSKEDILEQIIDIKKFYNSDIKNYSSLFLGLHDAFNCSFETIKFSIEKAMEIFQIENSYVKDKNIFLFASVESFLNQKLDVFEYLNKIPDTKVFINMGLESVHQETLRKIGKPIDSSQVRESFEKMLYVNKKYINIEITANFLLDLSFSEKHFDLMISLIRDTVKRPFYKGTIYLSPLSTENKRDILNKVMELKRHSFLPMYLYIIQRF
ncbi:radical SAM protein [Desulfothermus sp.]